MPTTCPYHYLTHLKCNAETCKTRKSYPQNEMMDQRYFFLLKELYDKNHPRRGVINKILKDKFLKFAPNGEEAFVHSLSQMQREGIPLKECVIKHANLLETVMNRYSELFSSATQPSVATFTTQTTTTSSSSSSTTPPPSGSPIKEEEIYMQQCRHYTRSPSWSMLQHDNSSFGTSIQQPEGEQQVVTHPGHISHNRISRRSPPSISEAYSMHVVTTSSNLVTINPSYQNDERKSVNQQHHHMRHVVTSSSTPPSSSTNMSLVPTQSSDLDVNPSSFHSNLAYHDASSFHTSTSQKPKLHSQQNLAPSNLHRFDPASSSNMQHASFPNPFSYGTAPSTSHQSSKVSALKHLKEKYANVQNLEKPSFVNNNATSHSASTLRHNYQVNVNNNSIVPPPSSSFPQNNNHGNTAVPFYGQSSTFQHSLPSSSSWNQQSHAPSLTSTSSAYFSQQQPKSQSPLSDILTSSTRHHLASSSSRSSFEHSASGLDQLQQRKRGYSDSFYQETALIRNADTVTNTERNNTFGNSQLRSSQSERTLNACPSAEFTPISLSSRSGEEDFNATSSNVKRRKNDDILLPSISQMMNEPPHKSKLPSPSQ
ncbi:hypothetical protein C9374_008123 [Naegleria lovaniensis]|uniref:Uncharacterized protein n=1 Tax=Naegleria lovaniensis TaxID=51637 RepID=A0AA88GJ76_NAELO|nr:uncharacterized protein C9374_008123 [Naegleria lovaniensis]KAG2378484.1 hypothetical protein C9374_008123 [Naegleria lovaniensis]